MAKGILAKNTTYFTGALAVQKVLSFVYFWLISNQLMPGQLGQYIFALSFTAMFSIFADLGLSPILTREASKQKDQANAYLRSVIGVKCILSVLTLVAAVVAINLTHKPVEVRTLVYIASFITLLDSFSLSFWVMFRARHTLGYESIGTILVQVVIFVLGIVALRVSGEVRGLIIALLAASIFNFIYSAVLVKRVLGFRLSPQLNRPIILHFLKIIPAFAIAGIFVKVYNTADSVLLSFLSGDAAVGFYAVPAKVVYAFQQVIPAAFAAVIFPAFSHYYHTSRPLLEQTFDRAFGYLTILSLPLATGLAMLAGPIIQLVWPEYLQVVPTFMLMAIAIPFIFLAFPTGYLLNACDRQRYNTINRGFITVVAVVLNLMLIPTLGYYGSGLAFLITNVVLLFIDFWWVRSTITVHWRQLSLTVGRSLAAVAAMAASILALQPVMPLLVTISAAIVVYFAVLYVVGGLRELNLRQLLPGKSSV